MDFVSIERFVAAHPTGVDRQYDCAVMTSFKFGRFQRLVIDTNAISWASCRTNFDAHAILPRFPPQKRGECIKCSTSRRLVAHVHLALSQLVDLVLHVADEIAGAIDRPEVAAQLIDPLVGVVVAPVRILDCLVDGLGALGPLGAGRRVLTKIEEGTVDAWSAFPTPLPAVSRSRVFAGPSAFGSS